MADPDTVELVPVDHDPFAEWQNMAEVYRGTSKMANPEAFSGAVEQMPQAGIEDRRAESIPLIDRALTATTGMDRSDFINAVYPQWYAEHKPRAEIEADIAAEKTPLAREAGTESLDALERASNAAWYRSQHPEKRKYPLPFEPER